MSLDQGVQLATLISIVFGVVAFFWGVRTYNRQMNAQVFIEHTKRYGSQLSSRSYRLFQRVVPATSND